MEYLVKEGFKDAVAAFQEESGIDPGVNMSTLDDQIRIRDAVEAGLPTLVVCSCGVTNQHSPTSRGYPRGSGTGERCRS